VSKEGADGKTKSGITFNNLITQEDRGSEKRKEDR